MNRLAPILCALLASLTLSSCNVVYGGWGGLYHHRGGYGKTYRVEKPSLPKAAAALDILTFEQPSLVPITYQGEELYQLVEPWGFPLFGHWIEVPVGIVVDGASVPRACWSFMPRDGQHRAGALAHDFSYQMRGILAPDLTITRQQADAMLRDMMERAGCGKVTSSIVYAAVQVAGWHSWGSHAPIILPVEHRRYAPRFLPARTPFSHIYAP